MSQSQKSTVGLFITSDPDTTRIQARPEGTHVRSRVPFRILFAADLVPEENTTDWQSGAHVFPVDANSFAETLQTLAPTLSVEVRDRAAVTPALIDVQLQFRCLQDFHPEGIVAQVPDLAALLDLRTLIDEVRQGKREQQTFLSRLLEIGVERHRAEAMTKELFKTPAHHNPAPRTKGAPAASDPLDRLLGMVAVSEEQAAVPEDSHRGDGNGLLGAIVGAAAGAADRPHVERAAAQTLLDSMDALLQEGVADILSHPAVRALEAAWRGLKFLVDRLDFRNDVLLDMLAAPRPSLDDALYHQVLMKAHREEDAGGAPSLVIVDAAFSNRREDVALLEELAETAASLQVPLIAGVHPAFFDREAPEKLAGLPFIGHLLQEPAYIEWNKLREDDAARFLALALPPLVLRDPYGPRNPVRAFPFEEEGILWGSAALVAAAAAARSFAQTGHPTHLSGADRVVIENLPVWKSGGTLLPLAVALSDEKQAELADAGFLVLACKPDTDAAFLTHTPMVWKGPGAAASLADSLFLGRIAEYLTVFRRSLTEGATSAGAAADLQGGLRAFLGLSAGHDEAAVEVSEVDADGGDAPAMLVIRIRPPSRLLPGETTFMLSFALPPPSAA